MQVVNAVTMDNNTLITVQCEFITGSDAQGCMIVLVSNFENITVNLTKSSPCTVVELNVTQKIFEFTEVFGYDIESNGSVGSLPIYGILSTNNNIPTVACTATESELPTSKLAIQEYSHYSHFIQNSYCACIQSYCRTK